MRSLILALLPALMAMAPAQAAEPAMSLDVKPRLCIIDRSAPRCDMSLRVTWESDRRGDYCLSNDFVAPLECWDEERTGMLAEQRSVTRELRYWMSGDADEPLADATVEVLRLDDGDRRRHRRTRHVWSVF